MMTAPVLTPLLEGPWQQAPCVDELLPGESVAVLSQSGRWRYVETAYGYTGWTEGMLLSYGRPGVPVTVRFCPVYPAPDRKRPPVMVLPRGALVRPGQCREDLVLAEGLGWIERRALIPPEQAGRPLGLCALETARDYLGTPYRWGGRSPLGIDCSGLCLQAYLPWGVTLWRDARLPPPEQALPIPMEQAMPGDLIFFPGHMALYAGDGKILHASQRRGGVLEEALRDRLDLRSDASFYRLTAASH